MSGNLIPRRRRLPGLDLLRSVAIIAVLLHHYPRAPNQWLLRAVSHYGWAGVDLFFVLSGYLIAGQVFFSLIRGTPISLKSFYFRRLIRILPNYLVVLSGYVLLSIAQGLPVPHLWRFLTFTQNFGVPAFFITSWSLCVEQHFYLAFPLVVRLLGRAQRAQASVLLFGLTLAWGIAVRYLAWARLRPDLISEPHQSWEVYFANIGFPTYSRLDGITFGVALAAIEHFRPQAWQRLLGFGDWLLLPAGALFAFVALAASHQMGFFYAVLSFPILGLAFALLLAAAVAPSGLMARSHLPGVTTLAVWSYAIYLTHGFALSVASEFCAFAGLAPHGIGMAFSASIAIALCGAMLYYGVERVFLRVRDPARLSAQQMS